MESLRTSLSEELRCALCLDLYDKPKLLPCNHSFCLKCLERLAAHLSADTEGSIVCPKCRECHHILIDDLKCNFELQNVVNIFRHHNHDSGEDIDESDDAEHRVKSADCEAKKLLCPLHNGQEIKLFCETCEVAVCSLCISGPEHCNHVCTHVEDAREVLAANLSHLVADVMESKSKLKEQFSIIEDVALSRRGSIARCRDQLNQYFDHHADTIRKEMASLQQTLKQTSEHQTVLNNKLGIEEALLEKQFLADKEVAERRDCEMSQAIASAEKLCSASGLELATNFQEVCGSLKAAADAPSPQLTRNTQWKFCGTKSPLTADIISPDYIEVKGDGLSRATLGLNQFTVTMLQHICYCKPELQVRMILPNGEACASDSIEIKQTGEWSWAVSYFLTAGCYSFKGLYKLLVLTVEVTVCGVQVKGSPFKVLCDKLLGRRLII